MEENEKKKMDKLTVFGFASGALSVAAWFTAMDWQGPFDFLDYAGDVLAMAFFGFLFFVLGLVPFAAAQKEKGTWEKTLTIAGALALNCGLIWYCFFR